VSNAAVAQQAEAEAQRLRQCQQELDTLRDLKADSYAATQHTFSTLMQGAAQYAKLRTQVNTDTQETVDALYRYRVNVLCAQINQAVLVGLMTQGEAPK
jgi:phosphoglycolate phosphatase-like HAD superfamily hydrolase